MELVLIALVGTLLLMAAELRDFVQRGRRHSEPGPTASAASRLMSRPSAGKPVRTEKKYLYDAAA